MFRALYLLCFALCALMLMNCAPSQSPPGPGAGVRNVILIAIDTLRAENLGFMGYDRPTSPILDEFSKRCIIFDRAYTTKAQTLPAFTSLFSGQHIIRHKITGNGMYLPEDMHFLTQDFRDAGFLTVGYPAAETISGNYGINGGFDFYAAIKGSKPGSHIVEMVKDFIEGIPPADGAPHYSDERPAFLFIHFWDPHTPYTPSRPNWALFADPSYRGPLNGQMPTIRAYNHYEMELTGADLQRCLDLYDAELRGLDDCLKDLLELFEKTGLMENSLIIFTADHGENLGEHHYITHGHPYEQGLHIPLMFHFPSGFGAGTRIDALVEITDVLPTVAEIVNIPLTGEIDGHSLLPLMVEPESTDAARKYLLARGGKNDEDKPTYSLFDGTYRLIKDFRYSETSMLYNIEEDRHETTDIAADNPKLVELMESIIVFMAAGLTPPDTEHANLEEEPDEPEMDQETKEMLRSLGYLN